MQRRAETHHCGAGVLTMDERGVDRESDVAHGCELRHVHLTGFAVHRELEASAADLVEGWHLRETLCAPHRSVPKDLTARTEPLLNDLAVAEPTAARADPACGVLDLAGRQVERLHRELAHAPASVATRFLYRSAGDRCRPARARRPLVGDDTGIAVHDTHALERHAELFRDDLREYRPGALPQLGRTGEERDRRIGVDAHCRGRCGIRARVRR